MKRAIFPVLAGIIALVATSVDGRADVIGIYTDSTRTDCAAIPIGGPSFLLFFVYHYSAEGASGCRFRFPRPPCIGASTINGPILNDKPFSWTGDLESGIEFDYGACLTGWTFVASVAYWDVVGLGGWPNCCEQQILAHPSSLSGYVEAIDCGGSPRDAVAFSGFLTLTEVCQCSVATGIAYPTCTWGAIKALYSGP